MTLIIAASRVPEHAPQGMRTALLVVSGIAFTALLATVPRLGYPPLLAERRAAIRAGEEVPSTRREFGHAWQDWCDELTLLLREHGSRPERPEADDFASLRLEYLKHRRNEALRLYDEGCARGIKPCGDGLDRRSFYDADDAATLWALNDEVFKQLIYPLAGQELARDERLGDR